MSGELPTYPIFSGKKRIGLFRRNDIYLPPYANDYLTMLRETLMTQEM